MFIEGTLVEHVFSPGPPPKGRELVVIQSPGPPVVAGARNNAPEPLSPMSRSPLRELVGDLEIRHASPREIANLSLDLYLGGFLGWDEYAMLAFQPELHPDFDKTIGALTGERARPDVPRDFVQIWEDRLAFEQKYSSHAPGVIEKTDKISRVFQRLDSPIDYNFVA